MGWVSYSCHLILSSSFESLISTSLLVYSAPVLLTVALEDVFWLLPAGAKFAYREMGRSSKHC